MRFGRGDSSGMVIFSRGNVWDKLSGVMDRISVQDEKSVRPADMI